MFHVKYYYEAFSINTFWATGIKIAVFQNFYSVDYISMRSWKFVLFVGSGCNRYSAACIF